MSSAARSQLTTHHLLKVIALLIMTVDHIGAFIYPEDYWWRALGRLATPVWFFLIGFVPSAKLPKDIWLWAGVLVLINPLLGNPFFPTNVLVTLACCKLALRYVERYDVLTREPLTLLVAAFLLLLPSFVLMEYGTEGFLFALMGYAARKGQMDWKRGKLVTAAALTMFLVMQTIAHPYTVTQVLVIIAGILVCVRVLYRYEYRPVRGIPAAIGRPMLFLARHSMQYYVLHRVILQAIGVSTGTLDPSLRLV